MDSNLVKHSVNITLSPEAVGTQILPIDSWSLERVSLHRILERPHTARICPYRINTQLLDSEVPQRGRGGAVEPTNNGRSR